ncbi:MAG: nucleoside transporter C-terminal domain-containing protein [Planctomycetota bacterium]
MVIARALLGLLFFCFVAWLMSSARRKVDLRVVLIGISMQVLLAVLILKTDPGRQALDSVSRFATTVLGFGGAGARMVFGDVLTGFAGVPPVPDGAPPEAITLYSEYPFQLAPDARRGVGIVSFAFKALPTILYFSAVMAILYHFGVMQRLIRGLAWVMQRTLRTSGAESMAMAANVFVGQTEAPLVVRPYIGRFTRSELMALMTGGFATIAGSVLAVYIGVLGEQYAGHLLAASFMSAPAAFVIAKIMVPETEAATTAGTVDISLSELSEGEKPVNVLDAAAAGTSDGLKLYLNVIAMLVAFVALVALINWMLSALMIGDAPLTLERIFGWVFAPVAWMMGVEWSDCQSFGTLLGTKVAVNEFVAYNALDAMRSTQGAMSERSVAMAAYALCGFANFSSIGIQIGGISPLAPERRKDISQLALRAMLGGAFASWMTATIAGMFL